MDTKLFLQNVLSAEGYYCVWGYKGDKHITKYYNSIDKVIDTARKFDVNGYNAFFALSTFDKAGSRKVNNIKYIKSFFLDLDCGASKDYPNQREALKATKNFCSKLKLPKPLMVNSGRGIHLYWVLDKAITYNEWFPVAEKLKKVCQQNNLRADPAVTSDGARVLRIPETTNYKEDPLDVKIIQGTFTTQLSIESFSNMLGGVDTEADRIGSSTNPSMVNDKLHSNMENVFKNILVKIKNGKGCEQLKYIIKNQKDVTEPLWRAGLSIARFCTDAESASRIISKDYPEYSENQTQAKLELIKAPYLCNTFDQYNPDICPNCPHWGKIKSPIVLGLQIKEAEEEVVLAPSVDLPDNPINQYTIPKYPQPYFRGSNGGVYVRVSNPDGDPEDKLIYHNDLYVVRRLKDPELGEAIVMRLHLPKDGVREFTAPLTAVTSKEEFRKHMSMQGVAVTRMEELMKYTTTWVNELQATNVADQAHRQFGWTSEDCDSFVLGNQELHASNIEFNPPSSQTAGLFPSFEPKGTMEDWKKAINFYNREGFELHQFVIGTSFGSPLMQFMPINCAGLHLHGGTGVGKTTAMQAGASVWGKPEDLILNEDDTFNTKMNRGEVYHNLPMYMDELTNSYPRELSNMAYRLTGGRQRGRMTSGANTERYRGEAWRLLAVTTGNASIVEKISMIKAMPKAEAQRILECKVEDMSSVFESKEETDTFSKLLQNNYGHAGKVYIQYIINNKEEVKKLLNSVQVKVDTVVGLTAQNRFWSALVSCSMTGLILAKKLGLLEFDIKDIFKWITKQLEKNLVYVNDMGASVEEVLNDYIHEHWSNVLWIKSTDDLREGDASSLVVPEAVPRGKLVARYETDLQKAYLLPKPLKKWCGEHQINYGNFIQDLKDKLKATQSVKRLSKGTHLKLPATKVIIVNCKVLKEDESKSIEDL
jgi:uncharacterized protein (DUF927 family)